MEITAVVFIILQRFDGLLRRHIGRILRNNVRLRLLHILNIFLYLWQGSLHLLHLLHLGTILLVLYLKFARLRHSFIEDEKVRARQNHDCKEYDQKPLIRI